MAAQQLQTNHSTTSAGATCTTQDADAKTYQCIKCQVSFDSEPEIQRHVASHVLAEGASLECRLCRRVLASPLKLQAHLIEHTFAGCGAFTCYLCSAVFTAAAGLQAHMLQHGLHARPYDCSRCALRFFFRAELEHHSYSHMERDAQQAAVAAAADLAGKVAYYQQQHSVAAAAAANGGFDSLDGLYFKVEEPSSPPNGSGKPRSGGSKSRSGRVLNCPDCGKSCSHPRALALHQQRHHPRAASSSPPPPPASRVKEEPASSDEAPADGFPDQDASSSPPASAVTDGAVPQPLSSDGVAAAPAAVSPPPM